MHRMSMSSTNRPQQYAAAAATSSSPPRGSSYGNSGQGGAMHLTSSTHLLPNGGGGGGGGGGGNTSGSSSINNRTPTNRGLQQPWPGSGANNTNNNNAGNSAGNRQHASSMRSHFNSRGNRQNGSLNDTSSGRGGGGGTITPPITALDVERIDINLDTPPTSYNAASSTSPKRHNPMASNSTVAGNPSTVAFGGGPSSPLLLGVNNNNSNNNNVSVGNRSAACSTASSQAVVRGSQRAVQALLGSIGTQRNEREMVRSGWLEKFSVGRGFFPVKNWQKRWFHITGDGLNYAKKPGGEMAVRTFIPFVASRKPELRLAPVFLLPNILPNIHPEAKDPKVYYFGLKFEEKGRPHILLLRTISCDERDSWVRFLAQFLHVGNNQGIPPSHPLDPAVVRLHDPEQLDMHERLALRKVVLDWDEGYQEYRHRHVDRVNRAIGPNGGMHFAGGAGGAGGVSSYFFSNRSSNTSGDHNNAPPSRSPSAGSQALSIHNNNTGASSVDNGVSRTASAKSGGNRNNNNNNGGAYLLNAQQQMNGGDDHGSNDNGNGNGENSSNFYDPNNAGPGANAGGSIGGGQGRNSITAVGVDVIIMDDSHVLAMSGMDPSLAKESYMDSILDADGGVASSGGGGLTSGGGSSPNSAGGGTLGLGAGGSTPSYQQRHARSNVLTLPSSPPTPTNDDL